MRNQRSKKKKVIALPYILHNLLAEKESLIPVFMFFRDRERERMRERQRERETKNPSRLQALICQHKAEEGLELMNREIMT